MSNAAALSVASKLLAPTRYQESNTCTLRNRFVPTGCFFRLIPMQQLKEGASPWGQERPAERQEVTSCVAFMQFNH